MNNIGGKQACMFTCNTRGLTDALLAFWDADLGEGLDFSKTQQDLYEVKLAHLRAVVTYCLQLRLNI